jgi:hypothetical protein
MLIKKGVPAPFFEREQDAEPSSWGKGFRSWRRVSLSAKNCMLANRHLNLNLPRPERVFTNPPHLIDKIKC